MKQGEAKAFVTEVKIFESISESNKDEVVLDEDKEESPKSNLKPGELYERFARLKKSLRGKSSSIL